MKKLLIMLLLFPVVAEARWVKCFSQDRLIYELYDDKIKSVEITVYHTSTKVKVYRKDGTVDIVGAPSCIAGGLRDNGRVGWK